MTRMGRMFADFLLICGFRVFIDVDVLTDKQDYLPSRIYLGYLDGLMKILVQDNVKSV
jgi:hypothetical protein